jgi:hypothetical protein
MDNKNVATQTVRTHDISTQIPTTHNIPNINLVINESSNYYTRPIVNTLNYFDCKFNKIMKEYNKKINENGHSVLNWRDYDLIHAQIANETINQLRLNNLKIPYWLLLRSKKNTYNL